MSLHGHRTKTVTCSKPNPWQPKNPSSVCSYPASVLHGITLDIQWDFNGVTQFNSSPLHKMGANSQKTFSDAFSWMKNCVLLLHSHWSLFLRVKLTISQHWVRWQQLPCPNYAARIKRRCLHIDFRIYYGWFPRGYKAHTYKLGT